MTAIKEAFREAVRAAIGAIGMDEFKKTSFFGSADVHRVQGRKHKSEADQ